MREIVYNSDKILLDEGTFFGQGLFETILCLDKPLFLKEHLNRLEESMKSLELETLEKKELLEFLENINIKNKRNFIFCQVLLRFSLLYAAHSINFFSH